MGQRHIEWGMPHDPQVAENLLQSQKKKIDLLEWYRMAQRSKVSLSVTSLSAQWTLLGNISSAVPHPRPMKSQLWRVAHRSVPGASQIQKSLETIVLTLGSQLNYMPESPGELNQLKVPGSQSQPVKLQSGKMEDGIVGREHELFFFFFFKAPKLISLKPPQRL